MGSSEKENLDGSPSSSPTKKSPNASPGTTPRTPRDVMVAVEGRELAVPTGSWGSDGHLEAKFPEDTVCTVMVKAGLTGRNGVHVVLRVGLRAREGCLRFAPTPEALSAWATTSASGTEECAIGALPSRGGASRGTPQPGSCQHSWCDEDSRRNATAEVISVEEALALGPGACAAEFRCRLALRVHASCVVKDDGQAALHVQVAGEIGLLPRLRPAGREAMLRYYKEARTAFAGGQIVAALRECELALGTAEGLRPVPREVGDVLNLMGALHLRRGAAGLAAKCLERALSLREALCGPEAEDGARTLAATLSSLGSAKQALGAHAEALRCHLRALEVLEKAGCDDAFLASALHGLGGAHRMLNQLAEASSCYERALQIREKVFGQSSPQLAATLNNLGAVSQQLRRNREAVRYYQRSLRIQSAAYGRQHPTTAATLSNLGSAHQQLGEHRCAVECLTGALAAQEASLGEEHAAVATTLHNLGNAMAASGHGSDAARCHWRALSIWSKASGPAHPDVASTLHCLGNVYRGLSRPEAAAKCFEGALRIREVALGPTHPETARTRHCAALVGCRLGSAAAAHQELHAAVNSLLASLGSQHPWCLQARADAEGLRQAIMES